MAEQGEYTAEKVVLICPRCKTENTPDSKFCRECAYWLVNQWERVLVKGRAPLRLTMKVGPRLPIVTLRRDFQVKTLVRVRVTDIQNRLRDLRVYVLDPNGNLVAGDRRERRRRTWDGNFETFVPGEYQICLDNSFSWVSSKVVELVVDGF